MHVAMSACKVRLSCAPPFASLCVCMVGKWVVRVRKVIKRRLRLKAFKFGRFATRMWWRQGLDRVMQDTRSRDKRLTVNQHTISSGSSLFTGYGCIPGPTPFSGFSACSGGVLSCDHDEILDDVPDSSADFSSVSSSESSRVYHL